MKTILISYLLLFFTLGFSQENCNQIKVDNDEVTGKTIISSEKMQFDGFSMILLAGKTKGVYPKMIFKTDKETCVDEFQNIYILFQNGKRIKSANYVYSFNCEGLTGFIINNNTNKKLLQIDKIKSIRIDTRSNFLQVELTDEQSDQILGIINCAYDRKSWESEIKY